MYRDEVESKQNENKETKSNTFIMRSELLSVDQGAEIDHNGSKKA